jgi:phosphopantothenoylcysteine synthetase/decarboxylase
MGVRVWTDEDEWSVRFVLACSICPLNCCPKQSWKKIGDPILHIELRRWADLVLIAPCSANTLAKLAGGICDDLSTSLLRALPPILPPPPLTSLPATEAPEKPDLSPTVAGAPSQRESVQILERVVTFTADDNASGEANQPQPTLSGTKGVQVWIFPAMNTFMYQHPLTERHLGVVQGMLKYRVVGPIGTL